MAAALVGAYGMLMNTYVASSRLMWISYMQHKGDWPALTGIGEKWGFLAFVFMEGRKREGPSIGLLNGFVKKNAMALLLLVIFGYGLEQFVSFAFRSLSLIVNQPGH